MSATTMLPARASPGGSTSGSFGAASVTVMCARMESPMGSAWSADSPLGRSTAVTGMPEELMSAATVSSMPGQRLFQAGAEDGVHDEIALRDFREVQLPRLLVRDLDHRDAEAPENFDVQAGVAFDVGEAADHEHRDVGAALVERPRHHEAVAAVVAAAAQHRDVAILRDRRRPLPAPPPPAAPRSPSAPSTESRSLRSSADRRPAFERRSARAFARSLT